MVTTCCHVIRLSGPIHHSGFIKEIWHFVNDNLHNKRYLSSLCEVSASDCILVTAEKWFYTLSPLALWALAAHQARTLES